MAEGGVVEQVVTVADAPLRVTLRAEPSAAVEEGGQITLTATGGSLAALLLGAGLAAGVHAPRKGNDARYSPGGAGGSTTRSMVRRR